MTLEELQRRIPGAKVVAMATFRRDAAGEYPDEVRFEVRDAKDDTLAVGWTEKEAVDRAIFLWGRR